MLGHNGAMLVCRIVTVWPVPGSWSRAAWTRSHLQSAWSISELHLVKSCSLFAMIKTSSSVFKRFLVCMIARAGLCSSFVVFLYHGGGTQDQCNFTSPERHPGTVCCRHENRPGMEQSKTSLQMSLCERGVILEFNPELFEPTSPPFGWRNLRNRFNHNTTPIFL